MLRADTIKIAFNERPDVTDECATKRRRGAHEEAGAAGRSFDKHPDDVGNGEDDEYIALEELLECELCCAQFDTKSELAIHRRMRHGLCAPSAVSNGSLASKASPARASAPADSNGARGRAPFPSGRFDRL